MTDWLIEGLVPAGALVTVADLDDPTPEELLAGGIDVVLLLHDTGDGAFRAGRPIRFSVHWRPGLPGELGCDPPAAFWVRFDAGRAGFVRVDEPEAA